MSRHLICPGCNRSIEPDEKFVTDAEKKSWRITYCPYERCKYNIDIEPITLKLWNSGGRNFGD